MLDPAQERRLVAAAQHDPGAFRELYRAYQPRIYGYVASRVPTRADAEDLVAETFMKAFENIPSFEHRGAGSFAAWLFRIARHRITDFYRYAPRRQTAGLDEIGDLPGPDPLPDAQVVSRQTAAHLREMIGTLSPRRQEIITLRFYGELRNQEIAAVLGLDERTVASHLCRGLEDLQARFHQLAQEDEQ